MEPATATAAPATAYPDGDGAAARPHVVGLGGGLRPDSTSLAGLRRVLAHARGEGAATTELAVRDLALPFFAPTDRPPADAVRLAAAVRAADALVLASPHYHGAVAAPVKNAIDWLELLAGDDPPYLTGVPVALLASSGGDQALQTVNNLDAIVRALRGLVLPLHAPLTTAWARFDDRLDRLEPDEDTDELLAALAGHTLAHARHGGVAA